MIPFEDVFTVYFSFLFLRHSILDPCFTASFAGEKALTSLSRRDAEFVQIVHTNPDCLGQSAPIGN